MVTAFQRGAFQFNAFQIAAVGWDGDLPLYYLRHNPQELERRLEEQRPFNRKRFNQLIEAERLASEAERLADGIKIRKQRQKALEAARAARAVIRVEEQKPATAPERVSYADPAAQRVLEIQVALAAFLAAQSVAAQIRATAELQSAADAIRRQQEAQEADDAAALSLLL